MGPEYWENNAQFVSGTLIVCGISLGALFVQQWPPWAIVNHREWKSWLAQLQPGQPFCSLPLSSSFVTDTGSPPLRRISPSATSRSATGTWSVLKASPTALTLTSVSGVNWSSSSCAYAPFSFYFRFSTSSRVMNAFLCATFIGKHFLTYWGYWSISCIIHY